jgi:AcrR family transcriptional regulator
MIAKYGWDAASIEGIAESAGLTYGAIYGRYPGRSELGLDIAERALVPCLKEALSQVFSDLFDSKDVLATALLTFARPTKNLLAVFEMLHAANFDPKLRPIRTQIAKLIENQIKHGASLDQSGARAASAATAAGMSLGLAMVSDRPYLKKLDLGSVVATFANCLQHPGSAKKLPLVRATYLQNTEFGTGSERLDAVFLAAFEEIGERGYVGATIARICRRANVSSGFVYGRYENKLELFLAVMETMLPQGYEALAKFVEQIKEDNDSSVAEAVMWRELQHPEHAEKRVLGLEGNRLVHFDSAMRKITHNIEKDFYNQRLLDVPAKKQTEKLATIHLGLALGVGFYLLPNLVPSVWELPYSAITGSLIDAGLTLGS